VKSLLLIPSFLIVSLTGFSHDTHKAHFTFQRVDGHMIMRADLDRYDLMNYFEMEGMECSNKNMAFCLNKIVTEHFSTSINGKAVTFSFSRSEVQDEYIIAWFEIEPEVKDVKEIKVQCDFFVDYFPKYQNVINCELGNVFKSYQMTSERHEITIEL